MRLRCTDSIIKGGFDKQFGVEVKWDIPLLKGYNYTFFKNYSWKPSISNGFFGIINFGILKELFKIQKTVVVVHGWHYFTLLAVLMLGKLLGHTVCLRCELPIHQEAMKYGWKQRVKQFALKHIIFPRIDFFLYIGEQNRLFYKGYGISENRLLFCPYSVDNERFQHEYSRLVTDVAAIKADIGIPHSSKVIVFSAKYIQKKRPLDLLRAFININDKSIWLIMVGEGELRSDMEKMIDAYGIKNVILTGFVNQSKISEYYSIGNVFVMCSGIGETWGLSVNEAMNFDLPLIISDISGCAVDLVKLGANGYIFQTGNMDDLTDKLNDVLTNDTLTKNPSSVEIVNRYSYETVAKSLRPLTEVF